MRNVFIDLGAFDGDTVKMALESKVRYDVVYAFEPLKASFENLHARYGADSNVVLMNCAADTQSGEADFYKGNSQFGDFGGSLLPSMSTTSPDKTERVKILDVAAFIAETFTDADSIFLKLDIEGKEYDVLDRLISVNAIRKISFIYCEWHYGRLGMKPDDHFTFVDRVRLHGFGVSGSNYYDEFANVHQWGLMRLKVARNTWYYLNRVRRMIKPMLPEIALRAWRKRPLRR